MLEFLQSHIILVPKKEYNRTDIIYLHALNLSIPKLAILTILAIISTTEPKHLTGLKPNRGSRDHKYSTFKDLNFYLFKVSHHFDYRHR